MPQASHPQASTLPGIVYDQPELYESKPIEEEPPNNEIETRKEVTGELDSIALIEVPIKQAFSYFAERENEIAQFYVQRHGEYKISADAGDHESDIEKYHRLVSEVNQLLSKFQAEKAERLDKSQLSAIGSLDHGKLTNNLEILSRQLKTLEFAAQDGSLEKTQMEFSSIENKLNKISLDDDTKDEPITSDIKLETAKLIKLRAMERRIAQLENILGHDDRKAQELCKLTNCQSLVETVNTLAQWAVLFRPENVQTIKQDVEYYTQKLESLKDSSLKLDLDPQAKLKLDQLFELVTATDKYRSLVPTLLQRLNAMEELQQKAAEVVNTINHLELVQTRILESLQSNQTDLSSLNEMFNRNMKLIKDYSANIESKVLSLKKTDD